MKRILTALLLCGALLTAPANGATLTLDGTPVGSGEIPIYNSFSYVPLRDLMARLYPDASITWEEGQAVVRHSDFTLIAVPGTDTVLWNGRSIPLSLPVRLVNGRTLVPVRPLAVLLGLGLTWDGSRKLVELSTAGSSRASWTSEDLYWLSRIISAESQGESWAGKIAVGNVVLNRVASPEFPNTIREVIFDARWGGQFEPVRYGAIYWEPTDESVRAARACLNGENNIGDALYFLAPDLTSNHWTMDSREYITTIGVHWFYR